MMNQVIEEFGPEPMEKEEKKRTAGGTDKNPRPKKRAGIIKSEVAPVKIEEMPTSPCLLEVTLSNVRNNSSMVLQVLAGSTKGIWLLNRGNIEQKLTPGFILSGFGKGEYKQQSPASDREILYDMSGLPQVLFQSSLRPLEEVVNTERLKKPACKVCYHDLSDQPTAENPGAWKLDRKLDISFVPDAVKVLPDQKDDKAKQSDCAALFPADSWNKTFCKVIFSVGWQPAGLMPIRPQVVIQNAVVIPPQSAVKL